VTGEPLSSPLDVGVIALPGEPPQWIWAFTCPMPGCACRSAIVLSVGGDRTALLTAGAPVRDARLRGDNYGKAADAVVGAVAFAIDIDGGEVDHVRGDEPLDLASHPAARAVVDRIDGETLEEIGRLWHRGKGLPDPEEQSRATAARIALESWCPGDAVAWQEAVDAVRQDVFAFGDHVYEAVELYHLAADAEPDVVVVTFSVLQPRGAPEPGSVRIDAAGDAHLEPEHERHRALLEKLWAAFCRRHPRLRERLARRRAVVQELGYRVVAATAPPPPKRGADLAARAKKAQRKKARRARQKNR
jgi:hypothetical protein